MVTDITLSTDMWDAIKTALTAANIIVTNSTTSATVSPIIASTYSDKNQRPLIVINPIAYSESSWKFGSVNGRKAINVNIDFYYSNTLGVEQMFDQAINYIRNNTISGTELVAVASDYGFSSENDNKYHVKSVTLTYDRE